MPRPSIVPPSQADLFDASPVRRSAAAAGLPEGFDYRPDLIAPGEERALGEALAALPFEPFDFFGHKGRREVIAFGFSYDYGARRMRPAAPVPNVLEPLRRGVAEAFGGAAEDYAQVLINRYAPGAGVGWHRDRPHFDTVVGVSLLKPCAFRFRHKEGEGWRRASLTLEPRSAYRMMGPARWAWEHSVPPVEALRYSITFRTLKAGAVEPEP